MRQRPDMEEIREKTEELCQLILDQPAYPELKGMIKKFFADDEAKALYNGVLEKQRTLQEKQQRGLQLSKEEVDAFEEDRDKLYMNPVSNNFMFASQEIDKVQDMVIKYLIKTIELDRVPTDDDMFEGGGCGCGGGGGGGCGCGGGGGGGCGCGH